MAHAQIYYTNSARFASQLAPGSSYETINLLPSIWQGGGLKSITSIADVGDLYNTDSWIPQTRRQTGSIIYDRTAGKYYMDNGGDGTGSGVYTLLPALTTGSPTFPGLTSSAGILVNGGHIHVSTPNGTMSAPQITASTGFSGSGANIISINAGNISSGTLVVARGGTGRNTFTPNGVLYGNNNNGLLATAAGTANSVLIANAGAPQFSTNLTLGGNIKALGTASFGATTVSGLKSNGIISGSSTLNIVGTGAFGDVVTANAGFSSTGVSKLSTITSSVGVSASLLRAGTGIDNSGYLSVQGDTQLGDHATDTTSVWGTLNVVHDSSNSGSITSDASGNLILDGSGTSSGVQITDGILWLGASGSTGIQISSGSYGGPSYNGGMISSSMKIVALHGFANRTTDGAASFEVDTDGNLECRSLKETSLRQYKHEIYYITESQLLNISKLKPVTFLYNQDVPQDVNDTRLRQAGFIAEQVQQIYPEVAWYKDGQLAGLQYQRLTAYLTRGIQELAEQNKLLKSRVQSLEQLVNGILQGAK